MDVLGFVCLLQWYIRGLLVEAGIAAEESSRTTGAVSVRRRLGALSLCHRALSVAQRGGAGLGHMVFNVSVRHWAVVRPLLVPGRFHLARASLEPFRVALEEAADEDLVWRASVTLSCAWCADAMGEGEEASALAEKAVSLAHDACASHPDAPLVASRARLLVAHVRRGESGSGGGGGKVGGLGDVGDGFESMTGEITAWGPSPPEWWKEKELESGGVGAGLATGGVESAAACSFFAGLGASRSQLRPSTHALLAMTLQYTASTLAAQAAANRATKRPSFVQGDGHAATPRSRNAARILGPALDAMLSTETERDVDGGEGGDGKGKGKGKGKEEKGKGKGKGKEKGKKGKKGEVEEEEREEDPTDPPVPPPPEAMRSTEGMRVEGAEGVEGMGVEEIEAVVVRVLAKCDPEAIAVYWEEMGRAQSAEKLRKAMQSGVEEEVEEVVEEGIVAGSGSGGGGGGGDAKGKKGAKKGGKDDAKKGRGKKGAKDDAKKGKGGGEGETKSKEEERAVGVPIAPGLCVSAAAVAAQSGSLRLAQIVLQRALSSPLLRAAERARADLVLASIASTEAFSTHTLSSQSPTPLPPSSSPLTSSLTLPSSSSTTTPTPTSSTTSSSFPLWRALRLATGALRNAGRLGSAPLVVEAAVLVWNLAVGGLALGGEKVRGELRRPLAAVASALESVGNPHPGLLARVQLEAAKSDAAEDALGTARTHTLRALSSDAGGVAEEEEEVDGERDVRGSDGELARQLAVVKQSATLSSWDATDDAWVRDVSSQVRPLTRHLRPLANTLAAQMSVRDAPVGAFALAAVATQRAKATKTPNAAMLALQPAREALIAAATGHRREVRRRLQAANAEGGALAQGASAFALWYAAREAARRAAKANFARARSNFLQADHPNPELREWTKFVLAATASIVGEEEDEEDEEEEEEEGGGKGVMRWVKEEKKEEGDGEEGDGEVGGEDAGGGKGDGEEEEEEERARKLLQRAAEAVGALRGVGSDVFASLLRWEKGWTSLLASTWSHLAQVSADAGAWEGVLAAASAMSAAGVGVDFGASAAWKAGEAAVSEQWEVVAVGAQFWALCAQACATLASETAQAAPLALEGAVPARSRTQGLWVHTDAVADAIALRRVAAAESVRSTRLGWNQADSSSTSSSSSSSAASSAASTPGAPPPPPPLPRFYEGDVEAAVSFARSVAPKDEEERQAAVADALMLAKVWGAGTLEEVVRQGGGGTAKGPAGWVNTALGRAATMGYEVPAAKAPRIAALRRAAAEAWVAAARAGVCLGDTSTVEQAAATFTNTHTALLLRLASSPTITDGNPAAVLRQVLGKGGEESEESPPSGKKAGKKGGKKGGKGGGGGEEAAVEVADAAGDYVERPVSTSIVPGAAVRVPPVGEGAMGKEGADSDVDIIVEVGDVSNASRRACAALVSCLVAVGSSRTDLISRISFLAAKIAEAKARAASLQGNTEDAIEELKLCIAWSDFATVAPGTCGGGESEEGRNQPIPPSSSSLQSFYPTPYKSQSPQPPTPLPLHHALPLLRVAARARAGLAASGIAVPLPPISPSSPSSPSDHASSPPSSISPPPIAPDAIVAQTVGSITPVGVNFEAAAAAVDAFAGEDGVEEKEDEEVEGEGGGGGKRRGVKVEEVKKGTLVWKALRVERGDAWHVVGGDRSVVLRHFLVKGGATIGEAGSDLGWAVVSQALSAVAAGEYAAFPVAVRVAALKEAEKKLDEFEAEAGGLLGSEKEQRKALTAPAAERSLLTHAVVALAGTFTTAAARTAIWHSIGTALFEVNAELSARIARAWLAAGEPARALAAANRLLRRPKVGVVNIGIDASMEEGEMSGTIVQRAVSRWRSVAAQVAGVSLLGLLDPNSQSVAARDSLSISAANRLCLAAEEGALAGAAGATAAASRAFLGAASLAAVRASAALLHPTLRVLRALQTSALAPEHAPEARAGLYAVALRALGKQSQWPAALALAERAFAHVPPSHQAPLWAVRVGILARVGAPTRDAIAKAGSAGASEDDGGGGGGGLGSPAGKAGLWMALAAASDPPQALKALREAAEAVGETVHLGWVELERGRWSKTIGLPAAVCREHALAALDTFLDVISPYDELDAPDDEDMVGADAIAAVGVPATLATAKVNKASRGGGGSTIRGGSRAGGSIGRAGSIGGAGSVRRTSSVGSVGRAGGGVMVTAASSAGSSAHGGAMTTAGGSTLRAPSVAPGTVTGGDGSLATGGVGTIAPIDQETLDWPERPMWRHASGAARAAAAAAWTARSGAERAGFTALAAQSIHTGLGRGAWAAAQAKAEAEWLALPRKARVRLAQSTEHPSLGFEGYVAGRAREIAQDIAVPMDITAWIDAIANLVQQLATKAKAEAEAKARASASATKEADHHGDEEDGGKDGEVGEGGEDVDVQGIWSAFRQIETGPWSLYGPLGEDRAAELSLMREVAALLEAEGQQAIMGPIVATALIVSEFRPSAVAMAERWLRSLGLCREANAASIATLAPRAWLDEAQWALAEEEATGTTEIVEEGNEEGKKKEEEKKLTRKMSKRKMRALAKAAASGARASAAGPALGDWDVSELMAEGSRALARNARERVGAQTIAATPPLGDVAQVRGLVWRWDWLASAETLLAHGNVSAARSYLEGARTVASARSDTRAKAHAAFLEATAFLLENNARGVVGEISEATSYTELDSPRSWAPRSAVLIAALLRARKISDASHVLSLAVDALERALFPVVRELPKPEMEAPPDSAAVPPPSAPSMGSSATSLPNSAARGLSRSFFAGEEDPEDDDAAPEPRWSALVGLRALPGTPGAPRTFLRPQDELAAAADEAERDARSAIDRAAPDKRGEGGGGESGEGEDRGGISAHDVEDLVTRCNPPPIITPPNDGDDGDGTGARPGTVHDKNADLDVATALVQMRLALAALQMQQANEVRASGSATWAADAAIATASFARAVTLADTLALRPALVSALVAFSDALASGPGADLAAYPMAPHQRPESHSEDDGEEGEEEKESEGGVGGEEGKEVESATTTTTTSSSSSNSPNSPTSASGLIAAMRSRTRLVILRDCALLLDRARIVALEWAMDTRPASSEGAWPAGASTPAEVCAAAVEARLAALSLTIAEEEAVVAEAAEQAVRAALASDAGALFLYEEQLKERKSIPDVSLTAPSRVVRAASLALSALSRVKSLDHLRPRALAVLGHAVAVSELTSTSPEHDSLWPSTPSSLPNIPDPLPLGGGVVVEEDEGAGGKDAKGKGKGKDKKGKDKKGKEKGKKGGGEEEVVVAPAAVGDGKMLALPMARLPFEASRENALGVLHSAMREAWHRSDWSVVEWASETMAERLGSTVHPCITSLLLTISQSCRARAEMLQTWLDAADGSGIASVFATLATSGAGVGVGLVDLGPGAAGSGRAGAAAEGAMWAVGGAGSGVAATGAGYGGGGGGAMQSFAGAGTVGTLGAATAPGAGLGTDDGSPGCVVNYAATLGSGVWNPDISQSSVMLRNFLQEHCFPLWMADPSRHPLHVLGACPSDIRFLLLHRTRSGDGIYVSVIRPRRSPKSEEKEDEGGDGEEEGEAGGSATTAQDLPGCWSVLRKYLWSPAQRSECGMLVADALALREHTSRMVADLVAKEDVVEADREEAEALAKARKEEEAKRAAAAAAAAEAEAAEAAAAAGGGGKKKKKGDDGKKKKGGKKSPRSKEDGSGGDGEEQTAPPAPIFPESHVDLYGSEDRKRSGDEADEAVHRVVMRTRALLDPVLNETEVKRALSGNAPIVILSDPHFSALPFECLEAVTESSAITRDFSLSVFGNRLACAHALRGEGSEEDGGGGEEEEKEGDGVGVDVAMAFPGVHRDDETEWEGVWEVKDRGQYHLSIPPVAAHRGVVFADPQGDCKHGRVQIGSTVRKLKHASWAAPHAGTQPSTAAWRAAMVTQTLQIGADTAAAQVGKWKGAPDTRESTSAEEGGATGAVGGVMIFAGPSRITSLANPQTFAGVAAPRCRAILCADNTASDHAIRRALRSESVMPPHRRQLLTTRATSALLSLSGTQSIALRQWAASPHATATLVQQIVASFKGKDGASLASAARSYSQRDSKLKEREKFNLVVYGLPHLRVAGLSDDAAPEAPKAKGKGKK